MTDQTKKYGPGTGTAVLMSAALLVGCTILGIIAPNWQSWQTAAAVGFGLSGVLAFWGLLSMRKAYRSSHQSEFIRIVFGAMLARLVIAAVLIGLVVAFAWLDARGFIAGLFGGVVIFQVLEIGGLLKASKRFAETNLGFDS